MRSYTQTGEAEVAFFLVHTYTPTFAFALHLKVIQGLCVCVCSGRPAGFQGGPPHQDGGEKGKQWEGGGGEGRGR